MQNTKWNGRSHSLEAHVSHHRSAIDELRECSQHITVTVPDDAQRVEYLIDSISHPDHALQAAIALVRTDANGIRSNFEAAASALIEVCPFRRNSKTTTRTAHVASIEFGAGRGSTGVDLRWHSLKDYRALPAEQKAELDTWLKTQEGKAVAKEGRKALKRSREEEKHVKTKKQNEPWKKKFRRALKSDKGVRSVMAILAEHEKSQGGGVLVSALQAHTSSTQSNETATHTNVPTNAATAVVNATMASASRVKFNDTPTGSLLGQAFPKTSLTLSQIMGKKKPIG